MTIIITLVMMYSEGLHTGQVHGLTTLPLREQAVEQYCKNTTAMMMYTVHCMYKFHSSFFLLGVGTILKQ